MLDRLDLIQKQQGIGNCQRQFSERCVQQTRRNPCENQSKATQSCIKRQGVAATDLEQCADNPHGNCSLLMFSALLPHQRSAMICERPRPAPGRGSNAQRFFLGLVVIARAKHPIPSRTRPLSAVAPMVLHLKVWESRSPPNLERNALSARLN